MQQREKSSGNPHVSQEISSCFRWFLNFCVSRRSCRLFWGVVPFLPFFLSFMVEGTGGLTLFGFVAVCSSSCNTLRVSLWTCGETETIRTELVIVALVASSNVSLLSDLELNVIFTAKQRKLSGQLGRVEQLSSHVRPRTKYCIWQVFNMWNLQKYQLNKVHNDTKLACVYSILNIEK